MKMTSLTRLSKQSALDIRGAAPQCSDKGTPHLLLVGKAAINSNRRYSICCFLKPAACSINTYRFDGFRRRAATGLSIKPGEVSGAHVYPLCECLDPKIALQMFRDPLFQFAEFIRVRLSLRRKQRAVLRLAARTLQINDEHAGDLDRDLPSEILLDQREG
jgi:hypothetical protein